MKYLKYREIELKKLIKKYPSQKEELKSRRLGKSTGYALKAIGKALSNPNSDVVIVDHMRKASIRHIQVPLIIELIEKLGLDGLSINKQNLTLRYTVKFI